MATVRSIELLAKLEHLNLILRERRLRWFEHEEHSSGAVRTACDVQIDGMWGAGRPKLTWKKLREKDCREWKPTTVDPQERNTWRSAVCAASQLPGRELTDVDCMLVKHLIIITNYINNSFRNIRVSNCLDPDQDQHLVGPDLGPNCLQKSSADNKSSR